MFALRSPKGASMKPVKVEKGFYIYARIRVPKNSIHLCEGKKQLVKRGVVSFGECPDKRSAIEKQNEWIKDLRSRVNRSLKFKDYVELYRKATGEHAQTSIVSRLANVLGEYPMDGSLSKAFEEFVYIASKECRKVWRVEDGKKVLCDTGKSISIATVKGYKRYFKAICGAACTEKMPHEYRIKSCNNPSDGVIVGKASKRRRRISEGERSEYLGFAEELFPAFVPAVNFARTMPIRPSDQIKITTLNIDRINWQIHYLPEKTASTETIAHARVLPAMRDYVLSRCVDNECICLFPRSGFARNGEDANRLYPMTYWQLRSIHNSICKRAGIKDLRFYDWRHDAVNYLLSIGFSKAQIMAFAGWNSDEMVDWYDIGDPIRLARSCEILETEANESLNEMLFSFQQKNIANI
jgi:integrase